MSEERTKKIYELLEIANSTGKLKKGTNETTKALERGSAVLVVCAEDVQPPEIVMHLPLLAEEKKIPFVKVPSKAELGSAAGLKVACASVAVIDAGEAKDILKELTKELLREKTLEKTGEKPKKEESEKEVKEEKKEA